MEKGKKRRSRRYGTKQDGKNEIKKIRKIKKILHKREERGKVRRDGVQTNEKVKKTEKKNTQKKL